MQTTLNQLLESATTHIGRLTVDGIAKDLEIATLQSMLDALSEPVPPMNPPEIDRD